MDKKKALKDLPGAQIDAADKDKVTKNLEKQETDLLNYNPHTQGE